MLINDSYNQNEPAVGFRYNVNILGKTDFNEAGFSEISGLSAELETEPFNAGGENDLVYHLPKQIKTTPLVLKRGLFNLGSEILYWVKDTINKGFPEKIQTQDIVILLMNEKNEPIIMWVINDAYPTKWELNGFNAMENKLAIETITFNYTNFEIEFI
ncbi:MAG: phage tail protein [Bacteroidota bacterium]